MSMFSMHVWGKSRRGAIQRIFSDVPTPSPEPKSQNSKAIK
jgi:hypothetical protein